MRRTAEIEGPKRVEVTTKENEVSILAGRRQPALAKPLTAATQQLFVGQGACKGGEGVCVALPLPSQGPDSRQQGQWHVLFRTAHPLPSTPQWCREAHEVRVPRGGL